MDGFTQENELCACPLFVCSICRKNARSKTAFMRELMRKSDEEHAYDVSLATNHKISREYWKRLSSTNTYLTNTISPTSSPTTTSSTNTLHN